MSIAIAHLLTCSAGSTSGFLLLLVRESCLLKSWSDIWTYQLFEVIVRHVSDIIHASVLKTQSRHSLRSHTLLSCSPLVDIIGEVVFCAQKARSSVTKKKVPIAVAVVRLNRQTLTGFGTSMFICQALNIPPERDSVETYSSPECTAIAFCNATAGV
jgi:hypothetical protein